MYEATISRQLSRHHQRRERTGLPGAGKPLTENAREFDNVVHCAAHSGRQRPESDGRRFSDDNPRRGRRPQGEQDGDDQAEGCLRQRSIMRLAHRARDPEANEEGVRRRAPEVNGPSAEVTGEDPRQHDEDHLQGRRDQTQGERGVGRYASLCAGSAPTHIIDEGRSRPHLRSKK